MGKVYLLAQKMQDLLSGAFCFLFDPFAASSREKKIKGINFFIREGISSDLLVFKEVLEMNAYRCKPHGIVLDVGANVGAFTLHTAQTANAVYAFEPESSNYRQLQRNVGANTFNNITTFKKAIGGYEGTALLCMPQFNKGHSSTTLQVSTDTERVEMITFEQAMLLCGIDRIDFLKVDIEGGEYALFENVTRTTLQRIDKIAMELHYIKGKKPSDLIKILEDAGFTVRHKTRIVPYLIYGISMIFAERI